MSDTSMMHIRLDSDLKNEATEAFRKMGLSPSEAVRAFLTRVVAEQAIPFDIRVPNATSQAAMRELRKKRAPKPAMPALKTKASARATGAPQRSGRPSKAQKGRFHSVTTLMADLNEGD